MKSITFLLQKPIINIASFGLKALALSSLFLNTIEAASYTSADPQIRQKRPFLGDIKDRIDAETLKGKDADQIMIAVREEVRVDQAVICLKRTNGKIFQLHSRNEYNGVVTDPAQLALYTSFFEHEKVQKAINEANVGAEAGTFKRPTQIISLPFKLDSNGKIQFFQANVSVVDKDHICVARFSSPGENQVYTSEYPAKKTNIFGDAVAQKVDELMQGTITVNNLQRDVLKNVEVEEAVICLYKVGEGNYFRLHSRIGNDGFVGDAIEMGYYKNFFDKILPQIKPENPRPDIFTPEEYTLANAAGEPMKFHMYPFVIDANHICFGRVLIEENGKPVASVPDQTPQVPAVVPAAPGVAVAGA